MGIDLIRSAYTTTMRFFTDSDIEIPVRWYFCDPNAEVFPAYTRFASGNWASDKLQWSGPGEAAWRPRPWSDGSPPGPDPVVLSSSTTLTAFRDIPSPAVSVDRLSIHKDQTIIVVILLFRTLGAGTITGITDSEGNAYVQDFSLRTPPGGQVGLDVWRARYHGNGALTPITVLFAGSKLDITFIALSYDGLLDQAPLNVISNTGPAGVNPTVGPLADNHVSRLILSMFSTGQLQALTSVPTDFDELAREVSNGFFEDGQLGQQIHRVRHQKKTLTWTGNLLFGWIAASLTYVGIGKFLPAGKRFCGSLETWANGGLVDAELPFSADVWGMSRCCGDVPIQVACIPAPTAMRMTLLAVNDRTPHSIAPAGTSIMMDSLGPFFPWTISVEDMGKFLDFPSVTILELVCNGFTWQTVSFDGHDTITQAHTARMNPPGMLMFDVPTGLFVGAVQETWDLLFTPELP